MAHFQEISTIRQWTCASAGQVLAFSGLPKKRKKTPIMQRFPKVLPFLQEGHRLGEKLSGSSLSGSAVTLPPTSLLWIIIFFTQENLGLNPGREGKESGCHFRVSNGRGVAVWTLASFPSLTSGGSYGSAAQLSVQVPTTVIACSGLVKVGAELGRLGTHVPYHGGGHWPCG